MNQQNTDKLNNFKAGCSLVSAGLARCVSLIGQIRQALSAGLTVNIEQVGFQDTSSANPYKVIFRGTITGVETSLDSYQWTTDPPAVIQNSYESNGFYYYEVDYGQNQNPSGLKTIRLTANVGDESASDVTSVVLVQAGGTVDPPAENSITEVSPNVDRQQERFSSFLHTDYISPAGERNIIYITGHWGGNANDADDLDFGYVGGIHTSDGSTKRPDAAFSTSYKDRYNSTLYRRASLVRVIDTGGGTSTEEIIFTTQLPPAYAPERLLPPAGESYVLYPEGYQIGPGNQNIPIPNNKFDIPDAPTPDNSFYYIAGEIKWVSGGTNTLYFKGGDVVTEGGDQFDYSFRFDTNAPADGAFHPFITSSTGNNSIMNENVIIGFGAIANPPTAILRNVRLIRRQ